MIPQKKPDKIPLRIPPTWPDGDYFVPSGCRCWYKMDEGSGASLRDSSGCGITGAITGATWVAGPVSGSVLSFDGNNDSVDLALVIANKTQTFEFWQYQEDTATNGFLIDAETGRRALLKLGTGDVWCHQDESAKSFVGSPSFNVWSHVVMVVKGIAPAILYVDTVSEVNAAASADQGIGGAVKLGARYNLAVGSFFLGKMGTFRAYDRALTAAEVSTLFAQDRAIYGI